MNINELEELTKQWSASEPEEYPATVLELIAAYRESVAALGGLMFLEEWAAPESADSIGRECPDDFAKAHLALATAKRLGVE